MGNLIYFILSSVLVAALPGPAMMLVMQGTANRGWQRGMQVTLGILAADAVLLAAVCLGLGGVIASNGNILLLMNLFSAFYLIYLGASSLLEVRKIQRLQENIAAKDDWQTGFSLPLSTPKPLFSCWLTCRSLS